MTSARDAWSSCRYGLKELRLSCWRDPSTSGVGTPASHGCAPQVVLGSRPAGGRSSRSSVARRPFLYVQQEPVSCQAVWEPRTPSLDAMTNRSDSGPESRRHRRTVERSAVLGMEGGEGLVTLSGASDGCGSDYSTGNGDAEVLGCRRGKPAHAEREAR